MCNWNESEIRKQSRWHRKFGFKFRGGKQDLQRVTVKLKLVTNMLMFSGFLNVNKLAQMKHGYLEY